MTQQDDEFHARSAEVARLMKRHEKLLDLLRDGPHPPQSWRYLTEEEEK